MTVGNGYRITEVSKMPEPRRAGRYDALVNDVVLRLEKTKPPLALRIIPGEGQTADGMKRAILKWLAQQKVSPDYVRMSGSTEDGVKVLYVSRGPKWFLPG